MLEVQNKSIIARLAERLSSNGHVSETSPSDILDDFFNAFKEANDNAANAFDTSIVSAQLLGLLEEVVHNGSNQEDDCDNDRSESKRSEVVYPSPSNTSGNLTSTQFFSGGSEVVGGSGDHHNVVVRSLKEEDEPDEGEDKEGKHPVNNLSHFRSVTPLNILVKWNVHE